MSSVIFDVTKQSLGQVADSIQLNYEDSMLVLAPLAGNMSVYAPADKGKYKGYHRFKFEVWIPEDAIEGTSALGDFGAMVLMRLPKNRVKDHLKREEE